MIVYPPPLINKILPLNYLSPPSYFKLATLNSVNSKNKTVSFPVTYNRPFSRFDQSYANYISILDIINAGEEFVVDPRRVKTVGNYEGFNISIKHHTELSYTILNTLAQFTNHRPNHDSDLLNEAKNITRGMEYSSSTISKKLFEEIIKVIVSDNQDITILSKNLEYYIENIKNLDSKADGHHDKINNNLQANNEEPLPKESFGIRKII